jgi:hypothetical protein
MTLLLSYFTTGMCLFTTDLTYCHCTKIKSQHECLLRELHLSLADGLITAKAFSTSQNDSFLGTRYMCECVCVLVCVCVPTCESERRVCVCVCV